MLNKIKAYRIEGTLGGSNDEPQAYNSEITFDKNYGSFNTNAHTQASQIDFSIPWENKTDNWFGKTTYRTIIANGDDITFPVGAESIITQAAAGTLTGFVFTTTNTQRYVVVLQCTDVTNEKYMAVIFDADEHTQTQLTVGTLSAIAGDGTVELTANSPDEAATLIHWQRSPTGAGTYTELAANLTNPYNDATAVNDVEYDYRYYLTAPGYAQSAYSNVVTITPSALPLLTAPVITNGVSSGGNAVDLTFTDPDDTPENEVEFEVQYSLDGLNDWQAGGTAVQDATTKQVTGLSQTDYDFRVRKVGNGTTSNSSQWSNIFSVSVVPDQVIATISTPNGQTNIPRYEVITVDFTVSGSPAAVRKLDGTAIVDPETDISITFKDTDELGTDIPYSATINAAKTQIKIWSDASFNASQTLYVSVNDFEDSSGVEETVGFEQTLTVHATIILKEDWPGTDIDPIKWEKVIDPSVAYSVAANTLTFSRDGTVDNLASVISTLLTKKIGDLVNQTTFIFDMYPENFIWPSKQGDCRIQELSGEYISRIAVYDVAEQLRSSFSGGASLDSDLGVSAPINAVPRTYKIKYDNGTWRFYFWGAGTSQWNEDNVSVAYTPTSNALRVRLRLANFPGNAAQLKIGKLFVTASDPGLNTQYPT